MLGGFALRWSFLLAMLVAACSSSKEPVQTGASAPQDEPAAPQDEPAAPPRPGMAVGFVEHLDESHSTTLVIGDPMPHLQRVLESEGLRRLLTEGAMAGPITPEVLRERVEQARPWIPEGIAIGLDGVAGATIVRLVAVGAQLSLLEAARAAGPASVRDDLPRIQADVASSLEAVTVPSMVVWARMRGVAEAQRTFDAVADGLGSLELPPAAVTRTDAALTMTVSPADLIDRSALLTVLEAMAAITSIDDPIAPRMADAILGLRATLSLTRREAELVLTLRPTDGPPRRPLSREQLGSLFDPDAADAVMWVRWDLELAMGVAADAAAMLDRWEGTEIGRRSRELDVEDVAGDVRDAHRMLRSMSPRGQARVGASDRVEVRILAEAPAPATALGGSPLLGMIPADAWLVDLDGTQSLAERLSAALSRFEDRLAREGLKQMIRGDEPGMAATEAASSTYYRELAVMRELVLREGLQWFEPPQALVMRTSEPMDTFEIVLPPGLDAGGPVRIPVPELALVGKPRDMSKARAWLERTAQEAVTGVLRAAGAKPDAGFRVATDVDLGLGVPTRALHLDGVVPGLEVSAAPGVGVHFFSSGDFLVVSTSARLSHELLRTGDDALALRDPALLGQGRLSGAGLGDLVVAVTESLRPRSSGMVTAGASLAALARMVDEATWSTSDVAAGRLTEIVVRFAE